MASSTRLPARCVSRSSTVWTSSATASRARSASSAISAIGWTASRRARVRAQPASAQRWPISRSTTSSTSSGRCSAARSRPRLAWCASGRWRTAARRPSRATSTTSRRRRAAVRSRTSSCPPWPRAASGAMSTTSRTRSTCSPWRMRWRPSTAPSWTPASCCKSTTRG